MKRLLARGVTMALLMVVAATFPACAGDDDGTDAVNQNPTPVRTGPAPTVPPIDAWILYRDDRGNIVARDLQSGDLYKQTVDFNEEVIVQAKCSGDGQQIAYLVQNFNETFRRISIRGQDAPSDFIQVPANVQGFTWSPDGTQIAIAEWDQTKKLATISFVDVASGEITELATAGRLVGGLDWSPDGSSLAYYLQDLTTGTAILQIRGVSGDEPREPVDSDEFQWFDPAWTLDGESLIVAGLSPTASQLFTVDLDSGETTQMTEDPTIYRREPQLSPDGSIIAFTGSIIAPMVSSIATSLHQFGIFMVNPDGSGEFAVTVDPRTNPGTVDPNLNAYLLGWCARGSWLDDLWVLEEASQ